MVSSIQNELSADENVSQYYFKFFSNLKIVSKMQYVLDLLFSHLLAKF